ncbi:MAG: hypothetical protein A2Z49_01510 [Chloroflexi bacterium RBG_19FT_COMBO_56_12]|nr:MAG: hypothetical protein A2Z49_01510 [Chloroflexi bacterium RBG_19FT_COMBO_56_12]
MHGKIGGVADPPEELIQAICNRYGVGVNYARAYMWQWQGDTPGPCPMLAEILRLPPPGSVWFEYWMNTNRRAEQSWQEIVPWLPQGAQRYLDIGCGVGGSLLAAHRRGLDVRGIEIDPLRIALGEANCLDAGLQGCIQRADVLDETLVERLGRFDVVTLMSVIEHVLDVPKTLENVTRLLNPGGILFMEIPNRECLSFVGADPHFSLFGITLLERAEAMAYQRVFFNTEYDVGDYYPLSFYRQHLERAGCETRLLLPRRFALLRLALAPLLLGRLGLRYMRYQGQTRLKLEAGLTETIQMKSAGYLREFVGNLLDRPWRLLDPDAVVVRHLLNVWVVVARNTLSL